MMKELDRYREALKVDIPGCKAAEAEAEKSEQLSVEVIDGQTGRMSCSEQTEIFVRASNEKTGFVYTQKIDGDALEVIKLALSNSEESSAKEPEELVTRSYWEDDKADARDLSLVTIDELKNKAKDMSLTLKKAFEDETGKTCSVMIGMTQAIQTMGIVNTNGVDKTCTVQRFSADISAEGYAGYQSVYSLDDFDTDEIIREFSQRKWINCEKIKPQAGVYRAVLSSQVVNNILITAWQMFSAKKTQTKGTPFASKLGQKIFSDCITIRDYKGGTETKNQVLCGFSWEMDCEGVPSQDLTIVENGVLKGWMHNLSTARLDKTVSTGNAGRKTLLSGNIHTDMSIMPKNFTIESGTETLSQLIEACEDGVYVFENYDQFHALNVVSGDFAFPCKAVLIKEKKPVGMMEGLTMNGNVAELFSCVEKVGADRVINPLAMYDSYTVSGPAMLVKSLRISG